MCAVAAIPAVIGLVISAATTATAAGLQADAASKQAAAEANAARRNAALAQAQRDDTINRAGAAAAAMRQEGQRVGASAQAAAAAGGLTDSGSVGNQVLQSILSGQTDADRIRSAAAREAWGYGFQASEYGKRARVAKEAGYLGALGAGLAGGGKIASSIASSPAWSYVK